ncbi:MAG TPA: nuclear transport factor 2 family protein [Rhodopila sp.]|jgi:ketosteroid isomerase-like protein
MPSDLTLLQHLYDRFNARDMEAVLGMMHPDVVWANGMEGGHVVGRDGVRDYWTRQWAAIDPHVEPIGFATGPDGEIIVEVRQTVHDRAGRLLSDRTVGHVFRMEAGLVRRFDIRTD